jgi:hypothetical protein
VFRQRAFISYALCHGSGYIHTSTRGPIYTGLFISPSGISDPCGTVAGMVTPKGSMSTEGETTPSFYPTLQVLDMCTLGDAADVNRVAPRVAGT